jgi:hypothetical protein
MRCLLSVLFYYQQEEDKLADPSHINLSNQALGISGANRDGTKLPITDEKLNAVVSFAQRKDEGVLLLCNFPISWIEEQKKPFSLQSL